MQPHLGDDTVGGVALLKCCLAEASLIGFSGCTGLGVWLCIFPLLCAQKCSSYLLRYNGPGNNAAPDGCSEESFWHLDGEMAGNAAVTLLNTFLSAAKSINLRSRWLCSVGGTGSCFMFVSMHCAHGMQLLPCADTSSLGGACERWVYS